MRLRFPEGMRSVVDATLALQGPATAPMLSGTVTRQRTPAGRAGSTRRPTSSRSAPAAMRRCRRHAGAVASPTTVPLRYDVRIVAPSTLRIENDQARDRRQQRADAARDLRPAAALRPRRDRARRRAVRGPPLSGHARQPRLHQPQPDSAVLRHRGGNARARARPDLPGDAPDDRHDRADAAGVRVRSAAGADRHPDAALQRHGAHRRHRAGVAAGSRISASRTSCRPARRAP